MNTRIDIFYCHATGRARIESSKPWFDWGNFETNVRVVDMPHITLKQNIMKWLMMGHDVTIKSV